MISALAKSTLITKVGDREEKISLQKEDAKRLILRDQYTWDLGKLGLRDGEEAVFFLQVFDNDTISGPENRHLALDSIEAEKSQRRASTSRRHGARLESAHGRSPGRSSRNPGARRKTGGTKELDKKFEQNLTDALKRTEDVMRQTEKDRMSDFATWTDLEALKRNLEFTKDELLKKQEQAANDDEKLKARDDIAAEFERMSLLSEDIGKRMKAQELASTAQDLARNQERLMDSLEKLQSGDKNLDAIMKQIAELAKTLASLQQAVSQLAQQMPDDFMNADTMQGLGFNDMFRALDEIRKKLMAGRY